MTAAPLFTQLGAFAILCLFVAAKESSMRDSLTRHVTLNSPNLRMTRTHPCIELSDRNATVVQAVGRTSMSLVHVDTSAQYHVSRCADDSEPSCSIEEPSRSSCITQYRWAPARVRASENVFFFVNEEILLPVGCTCVLGGSDLLDYPLIVE